MSWCVYTYVRLLYTQSKTIRDNKTQEQAEEPDNNVVEGKYILKNVLRINNKLNWRRENQILNGGAAARRPKKNLNILTSRKILNLDK